MPDAADMFAPDAVRAQVTPGLADVPGEVFNSMKDLRVVLGVSSGGVGVHPA
jgi:hypothetical protein